MSRAAWADAIQRSVDLDEVVKRTRHSIWFRQTRDSTLVVCTGRPLHARDTERRWRPVEDVREPLVLKLARWQAPLADLLLGGMAATTDFYPSFTNLEHGYVEGTNVDYATARSTSSTLTCSTTFYVGQTSGYYVDRGYLQFVTSSLLGEEIGQVNLAMTVRLNYNTTDFDVKVVKQDWSGQSPLAAGNREAAFDGALSADLDATWANSSGLVQYDSRDSANLDTTWINTSGSTYYSLVSAKDRAGTAPADDEYIRLYSPSESNGLNRPLLKVTIGAPPAGARTYSYASVIG